MVKKVFLSILAIIVIYTSCFGCYASSGKFDFATKEFPGTIPAPPAPPTPSDDPGTPSTPSEPSVETDTEPTLNITVPTKLEGVAFEDYIKETVVGDESVSGGTKHITNDGVFDPSEEPPVEGVMVSTNGIDGGEILTDNSGRYTIEKSGTFGVSFKYGGTPLKDSQYSLNKDVLKYNGQDYYMTVSGSQVAGSELTWIRRIKEMKKSYTEIYILIDYSVSMRDETEGTARLDIVKESAKNFINSLFENSEGNIAVGFIAFAYEAAIVKAPTEVRQDVIDGIDNFAVYDDGSNSGIMYYNGIPCYGTFSALNHKAGTNIGGAVRKAKSSFLSPDSNQIMVLFSDGCATAHDAMTEPVYSFDSDATIEKALNEISDKTRDDLQSVVDSDVTLISILNETEDVEREFVEKTFKNADGEWIGSYYAVNYDERKAVEEALLNDVKKIIESEDYGLVTYDWSKEYYGSDNVDRRKIVNGYYTDLYYGKIGLFQVIDKLTGIKEKDVETVAKWMDYENYPDLSAGEKEALYSTFINSNIVKKFMEDSWVNTEEFEVKLYKVTSSAITCGSETLCTFTHFSKDGEPYIRVSGGGYDGEYKAGNVHITETTIELNAGLVKRDEFKLELEQKITGYRLTLSDGTVLLHEISPDANATVENLDLLKKWYSQQLMINSGKKDKINKEELIEELKKLDITECTNMPELLYLTVDMDILQGATLEVEYTIIIKNNSRNGTFSNEFALINYFDDEVVYRPDNELLTEEGTNKDYGWRQYTKQELVDNKYISENVKKYGDDTCLYLNFNEDTYRKFEGITEDGTVTDGDYKAKTKYINPVIGNNQERYVKVVLSRVLSPENIDDFTYKNQAEIIRYANNDSRRINWIKEVDDATEYDYPIAGNYIPTSIMEHLSPEFTNVGEIDTALAGAVKVMPPTGRRSYSRILSIFKMIKNVFNF